MPFRTKGPVSQIETRSAALCQFGEIASANRLKRSHASTTSRKTTTEHGRECEMGVRGDPANKRAVVVTVARVGDRGSKLFPDHGAGHDARKLDFAANTRQLIRQALHRAQRQQTAVEAAWPNACRLKLLHRVLFTQQSRRLGQSVNCKLSAYGLSALSFRFIALI